VDPQHDVAEALPEEFPSRGLPAADRLPRALRPRERLLRHGASSLADGELLALVVGGGSNRDRVPALAVRLLRRHGLCGLSSFDGDSWCREPGVGRATAARLTAAFELGRRASARGGEEARLRLTRPVEVFRRVRDLAAARKEKLVGLYLDAQNGLLHVETISVGSLNTTRTHPREILYPAIIHLALGFVLVHNHPSGCLDPSDEDVAFTKVVQRAGETMGIELYDHLIVARGGFTSLRERGVL